LGHRAAARTANVPVLTARRGSSTAKACRASTRIRSPSMRSPATPAGAWIQRVGIVLGGSVSLLEPGSARPLGRTTDPRD